MSVPMSIRQLVEVIAIHLAKQQQVSMKESGGCWYRGEGGMKCAVGCLIPDEAYSDNIEGAGARALFFGSDEGDEAAQEAVGSLLRYRGSVGLGTFIEFLESCQFYHDWDWVRIRPDSYPGRLKDGTATLGNIRGDLLALWSAL